MSFSNSGGGIDDKIFILRPFTTSFGNIKERMKVFKFYCVDLLFYLYAFKDVMERDVAPA